MSFHASLEVGKPLNLCRKNQGELWRWEIWDVDTRHAQLCRFRAGPISVHCDRSD